jgi:hypothetical protein
MVVISVVASTGMTVRAQGWAADVSAGRLVYDPSAAQTGTNNVQGTLRFNTRRETWIYGTAALPAGGQGTLWAAAGLGGRLRLPASRTGLATIGADVGAHGFSFRDQLAAASGTGGTIEAMPFARIAVGRGFVEGRGAWRGHTMSFAGIREQRDVFETGARGGYGTTVSVEGEARWVHASEGTYPFVGGTLAYHASRVDAWGQLGRWMATDLGQNAWAVGSAVTLGVRTSVWGSVRQEAPDPLYWNAARRTWSVGLTQRLGRVPAPLAAVSSAAAGAIVRLPLRDAPDGPVMVAGDFNNWQAVPMQREGAEWVLRLPLAPGVYHYTFKSAKGEWFVPPSTAGRRDDGMGGYLAVLVVG